MFNNLIIYDSSKTECINKKFIKRTERNEDKKGLLAF